MLWKIFLFIIIKHNPILSQLYLKITTQVGNWRPVATLKGVTSKQANHVGSCNKFWNESKNEEKLVRGWLNKLIMAAIIYWYSFLNSPT